MLSLHVFSSILGVAAWLRMNKFAAGTRYWSGSSASNRISAFEPKGINACPGNGLTRSWAAGDGEGEGEGEGEGDGDGDGTTAGLGDTAGAAVALAGAAVGVAEGAAQAAIRLAALALAPTRKARRESNRNDWLRTRSLDIETSDWQVATRPAC
jgi:hypothetical protein